MPRNFRPITAMRVKEDASPDQQFDALRTSVARTWATVTTVIQALLGASEGSNHADLWIMAETLKGVEDELDCAYGIFERIEDYIPKEAPKDDSPGIGLHRQAA